MFVKKRLSEKFMMMQKVDDQIRQDHLVAQIISHENIHQVMDHVIVVRATAII